MKLYKSGYYLNYELENDEFDEDVVCDFCDNLDIIYELHDYNLVFIFEDINLSEKIKDFCTKLGNI